MCNLDVLLATSLAHDASSGDADVCRTSATAKLKVLPLSAVQPFDEASWQIALLSTSDLAGTLTLHRLLDLRLDGLTQPLELEWGKQAIELGIGSVEDCCRIVKIGGIQAG